MSAIVPTSRVPVSVRPATLDDIPFMDALQAKYPKQLGRFATSWFEGYIKTDGVLIAEVGGGGSEVGGGTDSPPTTHNLRPTPVGYVISRDRYQKRDELGVIYQRCVAPGEQRKLVGAELIRAMFERSAYGCKMYCCWCAQDIDANYFWESIGFLPIAFRAGSRAKGRVHILWQRRIQEGDERTPYWYPCQTSAGAMGEGRLVFPIPPGVHWKDVSAVAVPEDRGSGVGCRGSGEGKKRLPGSFRNPKPETRNPIRHAISRKVGLRFVAAEEPAAVTEKKPPRAKVTIDPKLARAARELRDRWYEHVNSGQLVLESAGKYDVARALPSSAVQEIGAPAIDPPRLQLPHAA